MSAWVIRILLDMPVGSRGTRRAFWDELCRRPADGSRAPDDVETQKSVVAHADTKGPALQPRTHCILQGFQVIPFLCFRCVLGCVETSAVAPVVWVERQHVNRGGRKHHQIEIMRVDPSIVGGAPALTRHSLHVLVVLLMWLLRPGEKEAARTPHQRGSIPRPRLALARLPLPSDLPATNLITFNDHEPSQTHSREGRF